MPDNRRAPSKLLVFVLALPVFALVYVSAFGGRIWAALRPTVATFLGATVIGTVYAEEAARRSPTPLRAAAVLALAIALVAPVAAPTPAAAAADPTDAVISAARDYLGRGYRLGEEGPRRFDCSGLIFRVFSDAGELPRIGGMRLRAAGYMRWFVARGLFTRKQSEARRGDLVVYERGRHIGIYVGDGKVISALKEPWGVSIHRLNSIRQDVSYFLQVDWSSGDGAGDGNKPPGDGNKRPGDGEKPGDGNKPPEQTDKPKNAGNPNKATSNDTSKANDNRGNNEPSTNAATVDRDRSSSDGSDRRPRGFNGLATGTMNLRVAADPAARIVGWVGRGSYFKIIGSGTSPAGYDWYQVQARSGKEGWIYSRWVQDLR